MNTTQSTAHSEWRAGWPIVLGSFFGFYSYSIMLTAMSVFMGPLGEEFGWSRTLLSAGTGITAVVIGLLSPVFGGLIDRHGPRRIALPGLAIGALGIAAMSLNTGNVLLWCALWLFYAAAGLFVNTPVWAAAVSGAFDRGRGLALAVALAGATAAQATVPSISAYLLETVGWRMALVWLGGGLGSIAFVVCWIFFRDPPGLHGRGKAAGDAARAGTELPGLTMAQAARSTALWRIGASVLLIMLLTIGFLFHQVEILVETGITRGNAAMLAGLAGAAGLAGKLVTGVLIDRLPGNWVSGVTMGAAALAFVILLAGARTMPLLVLAMLVNGYTAGAKLHIASYLTARYAGMRHFGRIFGVMCSLIAIGSGTGPMLAGMTYDLAGNYDAFLIAGTVGLVLSGLLLLSLPRYPDWEELAGQERREGGSSSMQGITPPA